MWQIGGHFQGGITLSPAYYTASGALALLSGETDGFAIDARTYPATVAVIDTGTPANDLSDVALDSSNLVQSGTSPKMVHNASSPYVRWSPHNMFLNSGTPATQNVTLVVGFVYTVTVTGAGGGDITGSAGASGTATTGSPATFTATTTTGTFTLTGSLDTIQLNRGATATTYLATTGSIRIGIPHSYDTAAAQYGILVEPAATNVCLRSEDLSTTWDSFTTATVSANATTSPDNSSTADKIVESSGGTDHAVYQSCTPGASGTFSVYLKAAERSFVALQLRDDSAPFKRTTALFNLSNGTIETTRTLNSPTNSGSSIVAIGNGWYRAEVHQDQPGGGGAVGILLSDSASPSWTATDTPSYSGDGASGAYAWGTQVELGLAATSYVPTVGATSTRAVDTVSAATSTYPHSNATGTMWANVSLYHKVQGTGQTLLQLDDGTGDEVHFLAERSATNRVGAGTVDGAVAVVDLVSGASGEFTEGTPRKAAYAYAANNCACADGGGNLQTDASATMPTVTTMYVGSGVAGATPLRGYILQMYYLPRRMTDADLQTETA
jgi:hypothetical protein